MHLWKSFVIQVLGVQGLRVEGRELRFAGGGWRVEGGGLMHSLVNQVIKFRGFRCRVLSKVMTHLHKAYKAVVAPCDVCIAVQSYETVYGLNVSRKPAQQQSGRNPD